MSRTYRNPNAKFNLFRKPKHKGVLQAATDEYGIRPGAKPPTHREDIFVKARREDFNFYKKEQKYDKIFRDHRKVKERSLDRIDISA